MSASITSTPRDTPRDKQPRDTVLRDRGPNATVSITTPTIIVTRPSLDGGTGLVESPGVEARPTPGGAADRLLSADVISRRGSAGVGSASSSSSRRHSHPRRVSWSAQSTEKSRKKSAPSTISSISNPTDLNSSKRKPPTIWPEWSDADINAEKWDGGKGGREKEKGKQGAAGSGVFDDPEGQPELPNSLKVSYWKRPLDFLEEKVPVVVESESMNSKFDIISNNKALHESELMRCITSQISALWRMSEVKYPEGSGPLVPFDVMNLQEAMLTHSWRPWEHIYAMPKFGKGTLNIPQFNPLGKYVVKLFWMGCWRKLVVDDLIPFDKDNNKLLPTTTLTQELWPMLLTKALLKIASLDYQTASSVTGEFGDFNVIHCLTGWLPEILPIKAENMDRIWELLRASLPEYKQPELPQENTESLLSDGKDAKKKDGKPGKDDKKKKEKQEKDEKLAKDKVGGVEESVVKDHPEVCVFVTYQGLVKQRVTNAVRVQAEATKEVLYDNGFHYQYPHPVLITQTRNCPMERPPPEEVLPAWKLIRPKKKPNLSEYVTDLDAEWIAPEPKSEEEEMREALCGGKCAKPKAPQPEDWPREIPPPVETKPIEPQPEVAPVTSAKGKKKKQDDGDSDKKGGKKVNSAKGGQKGKDRAQSAEPGADGDTAELPPITDFWMDFDVMCKCFKSLYIYHKTTTYPYNFKAADLSKVFSQNVPVVVPSNKAEKVDKKISQNVIFTTCTDEKSPNYLFVDSLTPVEIVVSISALAHWSNEPTPLIGAILPPPVLPAELLAPLKGGAGGGAKLGSKGRESQMGEVAKGPQASVGRSSAMAAAMASTSNLRVSGIYTGVGTEAEEQQRAEDELPKPVAPKEPLQPALLIIEPFSWKSLVPRNPVLCLRTTGVKTAVLALPEGRHVLRLTTTSPLCYHLQLCSATSFVFGDEEKVMAELVKESLRFSDTAARTMQALGRCLQAFGDYDASEAAQEELWLLHCPHYYVELPTSRKKHYMLYLEGLYTMLRRLLADAQLSTPEMTFAWRVFTGDTSTKNPLGIVPGTSSRPPLTLETLSDAEIDTGVAQSDRTAPVEGGRQSVNPAANKKAAAKRTTMMVSSIMRIEPIDAPTSTATLGEQENSRVEYWKNRTIPADEERCIVTLQKYFRGHYVRKTLSLGRQTVGDEAEISRVREQLLKAWTLIEPHAEQCGLVFYRAMFRLKPDLITKYSFYPDEWTKISFTDYTGAYVEQPTNSWFLLFRDVFYVTEDVLCVPKLYIPSCPTAILRVINNDTNEEVPQVFFKLVPYVYRKNKKGYTFVCEARTTTQPLQAGRWRMRLIGALDPLPKPTPGTEVNSSFYVSESRDYYLPNEKQTILRYSLKVFDDHLTTIQMQTSKRDVDFSLTLMDHEKVLVTTEGRGHAVLPAYILHPDPPEEEQRAPSRISTKTKSTSQRTPAGSHKRPSSTSPSPGREARRSVERTADDQSDAKPHKYIIEAKVLRSSWPLSPTQWAFVQSINDNDANENKDSDDKGPSEIVQIDEELLTDSPSKVSTGTTSTKSGSKLSQKPTKLGGKTKDGDKAAKSSIQFDENKAGWILKVINDSSQSDSIEVKKDSERADAIQALKKAWEDAEPGRAAKAKQSRIQYLNSHLVKVSEPCDDDDEAAASDPPSSTPAARPASSPTDMLLSNIPPKKKKQAETVIEIVPPIDLTPFARKTAEQARIKDEAELERQLAAQKAEIQAYRQYREKVEAWREKDRLLRNRLKIRQLEMAEQMQDALDKARAAINEPREAIRQKYLEIERKKAEELAAAEAARLAEEELMNPSKARPVRVGKKK